jgi:hypothetical protein
MTKPSARSLRLRGVRHPPRFLLVGLTLLLGACSAAPGVSAPTAATSPSFSPASQQPSPLGSLYAGTLSMDAIEGGCPYLQADDGRKLQVLYPDGWQLDKSPLQLVAPDGSVHAKAGDRVVIRGEEATDMVSICQIGPIIQATEVVGP